ncbi:MAG TPA: hypothetical protein VGM54_18105 [Chthoniobacter sp.]|jgi:hypothetical protein
MSRTGSCFRLHCDAVNSKFILSEIGEVWREEFDSFDDAYAQAEARAICKSVLLIFNERGQIILESTVSPLEPGLTYAREHWRKTAALAD